ncbi:MAG TPA: transglycosylase SLT domain-containing protein [Gemmatimonadaceae bacterium]|nr:transglycosylase SLT domain-containing protein [Gemmatimonadaceae bacterium]
MIRRASAIAIMLVTAGCASSRRGVGPVAPAPVAQTPAPPVPAPTPVAQQASPSKPVDAPVAPARPTNDSARVSTNDVGKRITDLFGDSAKATVAETAATAPMWDIEVHAYESTSRVERYLRMFTGPAKDRIESRLERGTRYEPMIRSKFREGGLPEDLYYLALVESGFDPNAYSRAAAVGMWQFMTSTGRDMGLRVDWWVDERRDPVKSTGAAVRFIKGLRDQFGSLYLAAAAYNGGPGRIARGLTRYADDLEGTSGEDLFFALAEKDYLRNETREYVPQLIAAALIAKEPARYGMTITPQAPFAYDSVRVGAATPLAAIAHASGATVSQVQELNPQILRGMTPPRDSVLVRIPAGTADSFATALAALPKNERTATFTVESKKGQSLTTIARKNGITTRQLAAFNPKIRTLKSGNLAPGQTILVPTVAVASAATVVPDPSIERYSSSRGSALHVVRSGETLGGIAKKYNTTTAALMRANGLRRALIFPGQSLVIRGGSSKAPSKTIASKSSSRRDATPALMTVAAVKPTTAAKASSAASKKSVKKPAPTKSTRSGKAAGTAKKSGSHSK